MMTGPYEGASRLLQAAAKTHRISAIAVCVSENGAVTAESCAGHTSFDEAASAVDASTLFDIASITKVFTASLAMSLAEDGALALGQTLAEFFPEWTGTELAGRTVLDLLTHNAGLPRRFDYYLLGEYAAEMRQHRDLAHFASRRAIATSRVVESLPLIDLLPPGQARYTSVGYVILGILLERCGGERLDTLLRRRITGPLGLTSTSFITGDPVANACATAHCTWRQRVVAGVVHDEVAFALGGVAGHAGLFSTARDVARFGAAFAGSPGAVHAPLSERSISFMSSTLAKGRNGHRGIGWETWSPYSFMGDLVSRQAFGHTGFTGVSVCVDQTNGRCVVLLTNAIHPRRDAAAIHPLRKRFHNLVFGMASGGGSVH